MLAIFFELFTSILKLKKETDKLEIEKKSYKIFFT